MPQLKPAVNSNDHILGSMNAPIELVEYGDYQCPHCGRAYPIIKNIQKKLGDNLKFVFRNFPLSEIHPNAVNAAVAAEAASQQNKFWEMHGIIYENQQHLSDVDLVRYAAKIALNLEQFKLDFETPQFLEKTELDFESGVRSGVNGTPSFFINGEKYDGDWDEIPFLSYLRSLI
ncbi:MAG: thioredoxin domain-containing protein [Ginsengibacter sp.]